MIEPRHTAFLLAAGFGRRLRPLTAVRPKALLPLCGVPMLDHALALVRAHGHEHVLVNAHHLWQQVAAWASLREVSLQVELPGILGTGGGLRVARDRLAERFVVVNADIASDVDLTRLLAACPPGGAAMALRQLAEDDGDIGLVEADADGFVVHVAGVVGEPPEPPSRTHFTGVHAMTRRALAAIPAEGEQCVVRTAYRALVPRRLVRGVIHRGAWRDVGTPAAYLQANLDALAGRLPLPVDPWSRGERRGDSWVGPGARVAGSIARCVVGDGARVPAGARLEACVVWDGVEVPRGRWRHAVFTGEGRPVRIG